MFDVLVYVYENFWGGDAVPELPQLERKLAAQGFDPHEIQAALTWLDGLNLVAQSAAAPTALPSSEGLRVHSPAEMEHLGPECLGFLCFLSGAKVLPPALREIVIDRAMAVPDSPVPLQVLKLIVLIVYWRFGQQPDALVLDELCDDPRARVGH